MTVWVRVCFAITMLVACGHKTNGGTGDPDGGGTTGDGGGTTGDGGSLPGCVPGLTQCSNCIDDDGDGRTDGFDPECTGASDNDEATFSTGIPGDNIDPVQQDCFFDGNSGAGNDGCNIHVCCLLGAKTVADCPLGANQYNPADCPPPIGTATLPQKCIDTCGKLAPPGCDCFGCCTICDPVSNQCFDIDVNPAVSPNCTPDAIGDPTKCLQCTKNTQCGSSTCGEGTCILCPGQDPSDLPASCGGTSSCPNNETPCVDDGSCSAGTYCSAGCCIAVLQ
jgi:hypothetical protein